jgi:hypothetical protein
MNGSRVAKRTSTLHGGSCDPSRRSLDSAKTMGQPEEPMSSQQNHFNSVIFSSPCVSRTGLQIGPSCSTGRNRIGWTTRRTRVRALTSEYRERADQVPPSRARPFGAPEAAGAGRPRLSLETVVPGLTDPGKHMPRSNRLHEANDPKSTAQLTARRRTDRDIETNADSQAARAGGGQVRISDFESVPASQLRHDDRDLNGAGEESKEGQR